MHTCRNISNTQSSDVERFHEAILNSNVDIVNEMLDGGLDPNSVWHAPSSCSKGCNGCTLLYIACVHNSLDIVQRLLAAGADPDKGTYDNNVGLPNTRSPCSYAAEHRKEELMAMLLRESIVQVPVDVPCYAMFRQFHDDVNAIKVLVNACICSGIHCLPPKDSHPNPDVMYTGVPKCPELSSLLHQAAKYRASELCRYLVGYCGLENVVSRVLRRAACGIFACRGYECACSFSYLMEVHGARDFVDDDRLRNRIMNYSHGAVLELLMGHFYQLHGDNKEWWRQQMTTRWTSRRYTPSLSFMHDCFGDPYDYPEKPRFACLLHWGVYSVFRDLQHTQSVFFTLAQFGKTKSVSVFVSLYPQCLQEKWFLEGQRPWTENGRRYGPLSNKKGQEVDTYCATLREERRHVPRMDVLCRTVIFHEMGINPIPKAEHLPLPKLLKQFVQCKELFEANT